MIFEEGQTSNPGAIYENPRYGEIEEIIDNVEKKFNKLKNYKIMKADPPSDHHYYYEYKNKVLLGSNRGIRMNEEHKLLEEKLPRSIFVRAYNTHVDVLRAAIIGPPNTPYGYGLFFFDILIPKGYPSTPPKFHCKSFDISMSPTLGKDGSVNLKLLEPWYTRIFNSLLGSTKEDQEKWDPKETTILNVLLAIQKTLCKHSPYCDESFVERWRWSNEREREKTVWLSTCERMLRTLNEPPQDFEVLVRGHFRKSAHEILMVFRDIKDGGERVKSMFSKLLNAFEANGTYCTHHLGQI